MNKILAPSRLINLIIAIALVAIPLLNTRWVYAASATLYLSPSSSSVTNGSIFTVNVRVNSGSEKVNAAEVHLSYPIDKLEFVRINDTSTWGFIFASSGGSGSVRIERGANPSVSGDSLIAGVQFKAKSSSGSATVSISSDSEVISVNSGDDILSSRKGGTYSLQATPPVTVKPVDKVAPKISKPPTASEISRNSAVISWSTSEPSTSEVAYGLNNGYGLAASNSKLVTEHKVVLSSAILEPGTTYHYMVKSVDPAGNAVSSDDATFSTKGYGLDVTVLNQDKEAVKGAKVTIAGKSGTTDGQGKVTLQDLPLGTLAGTVEYQGKKTTVSVTMTEPETKEQNQAVAFKIQTPTNKLLVALILIVGVTALVFLIRYVLKQRKTKGGSGTSPSRDSGTSSPPPGKIITPSSGT